MINDDDDDEHDDELNRRLRAMPAPRMDDGLIANVQRRARQALAAAPAARHWRAVRRRGTWGLLLAAVAVYLVWVDRALAALFR